MSTPTQTAIDGVSSALTDAKFHLDQLPDLIDALDQQITSLTSQLQTASDNAQPNIQALQDAQNQLATVTAERDALRAEIQRLNAAIDAAQAG